MTILSISIGISIAVIGLVVYSALVVSSQQERIAQRVREENRFERAPYSADRFAFETSEELVDEDEMNELDVLVDDSEEHFF